MIIIGLTGSIGMGKSTTTKMFADAGVPVWDADAAVHKLYGPGAAGCPAIATIAPEAVSDAGVDRDKLRAAIMADKSLLKKIEALIHPLVGQDRAGFLADARAAGKAMALCDIPLLFEGEGHKHVDKIVVVSAPASVQRQRVLERPGMTEETFEMILSKQVPDAEKRAGADFIVDTGQGMDHAREQVLAIIEQLKAEAANA
ncbi:MAG: dephospho-CoA kinase [Pseudomonadota bacterium]